MHWLHFLKAYLIKININFFFNLKFIMNCIIDIVKVTMVNDELMSIEYQYM